MTETARFGKRLLLLAGIMLVGVNLRATVASVGPLIGEIKIDTGLSSAGAGLLGSLPVLCFGMVSAFAPRVGRRFGLEEVLLLAMLAIAGGALIRLVPSMAPLFIGTAIGGVAIAFSNVLLPAVVKKSYPDNSKRISALYVGMLCIFAAVASAIAIPISETWLGWRGALGIWAFPALVAAAVWFALIRRRPLTKPDVTKPAGFAVLRRSRLAWAVMIFMATQAFGGYIVLTWFTEILIDSGIGRVDAGLIFSLSQLAGIVPILAISMIADSLRDERILVFAATGLTATGVTILLVFGGGGAIFAAAMIGLGQGAAVALALIFFVSRSANHAIAAELSGTGQALGYLLAASGPVLAGVIHDSTGSWNPVLVVILVSLGIQILVGFEAGRPGVIGEPEPEPKLEGLRE